MGSSHHHHHHSSGLVPRGSHMASMTGGQQMGRGSEFGGGGSGGGGSLNGGSTPPKPNTKKVKVLKHATNWSPSSKGAKMASFVKGGTFEVKQQRPISYSYSNQEYLIVNKGTVLGWVLSQDIEGGYGSDRVGGSKPKLPAGFTKEEATFINGNAPITTRKNKPSLSSQTATPLYPGQSVRYLGWKSAEGYIWIYATDGRYIPVRPVGKEAWGTFK